MSLWSRIANAAHSERLNREIEEELQSHLEEAVAAGRDPAEARRACAGVALGLESARHIESLFYEVKATDTGMLVLPSFAIALTALVATLPAVLRALRTNPTEILRAE